jgi:hypothetical protein
MGSITFDEGVTRLDGRSVFRYQQAGGISGGTMPIHVIWQKTWHLQLKVRVTVDELGRLAGKDGSVFNLDKSDVKSIPSVGGSARA